MKRRTSKAVCDHATMACLMSVAMVVSAAGCGRGRVRGGESLAIPTITTALPTLTNQPSLPVGGARPDGAEVDAIFSNQSTQKIGVASAGDTWTGSLPLQEGVNVFRIYASENGSTSPQSQEYGPVTLDTIAPTNIAVNPTDPNLSSAPPDGLYIPAPAQSGQLVITGTKGVDGDLVMTDANNTVTNVSVITDGQADGKTTWGPVTLNIVLGPQTFTLKSKDAAGNYAPTYTLIITGSDLQAPTIVYHSPTNAGTQTVTGTKAGGEDLQLVFNGGAQITNPSGGTSSATTWSYGATFPTDGTYTIKVWATETGHLYPSPSVTATIIYDTVPPNAAQFIPALNCVSSSQANPNLFICTLADTGSPTLPLSGTIPTDSQFCVALTSDGPCVTLTPVGGGAFQQSVSLNNGQNLVYVSPRDAAGNIGPETEIIIYRESPPGVVISEPVNNVVVTNANSLNVAFTATPAAADVGRPGGAVVSVQVCLDTGDCNNISGDGSGSYNTTVTLSNPDGTSFSNQSSHTVTITVTDASGAVTTQTVNFTYSTGAPFLLSLNVAGYNATTPKVVTDASGTFHYVWSDSCSALGTACPYNTNQFVQGSTLVGTAAPDIFYRNYRNGTWSPILIVSAAGTNAGDGQSTNPSIAVDSTGTVHVVWADDGTITTFNNGVTTSLLHRTINTSGTMTSASAGNIELIGRPTGSPAASDSTINDNNPSIDADTNGNVHASWMRGKLDGTSHLIYYSKLASSTWSSPLLVSTDPNILADNPALKVCPLGQPHVAWQECAGTACQTPYNRDVYMREVMNQTTPTLNPTTIKVTNLSSTVDGDSLRPAIMFDQNHAIYAAWDDTARVNTNASDSGFANIYMRLYQHQQGTGDGSTPSTDIPYPGTTSQTTYVRLSTQANQGATNATVNMGTDGAWVIGWSQAQAGSRNVQIQAVTGNAGLGPDAVGIRNIYPGSSLQAQLPSMALDINDNIHAAWADNSSIDGGPNSPAPNSPTYALYELQIPH